MLKGEEHPSCKQCWDAEKEGNIKSYRQGTNEQYPEEYNLIKKLSSKRLIDEKLLQIDIRQTNICNMKCLSCGPIYSSMWGAEEGTNQIIQYSNKNRYVNGINKNGVLSVENNGLEDYILSSLSHVKQIYFAGGEPLVNPLHWSILKELDRLERQNVYIYYNTNLLKLDFRGKHIFDYWDRFTGWSVGASIDAIGSRAEYVRTGTVWETVDSHIRQMIEKYPKQFDIQTTTSALSVGGLKDLMQYCKDLQITQQWGNIVTSPQMLHPNVLPRDYRQHVFNEIEIIVTEKIKNHDTKGSNSIENLQNFLNHFKLTMLESDASNEHKRKFKMFIENKDITRNTDIFTSCPEFKDIWSKI